MANEFFGKEAPMLLERLGRLLGSTTYRDGESAGGTPFSSRKLTSEAMLILALKMAQTSPSDVGPWVVYSIALRVDDRRAQIVSWLAKKLLQGTGALGRRNEGRLLAAALSAYQLAVHGTEPTIPEKRGRDFEALTNIGAGWLWTKFEGALDRAEAALGASESPAKYDQIAQHEGVA